MVRGHLIYLLRLEHHIQMAQQHVSLPYSSARVTQFTLHALVDDFPLAANRFEPPAGVHVQASAVISGGTGVTAKRYADFATYVDPNLLTPIPSLKLAVYRHRVA